MLIRTHLALVIFAVLLFVQYVNNKLLFIFVALIAAALPDIDSGFSTMGKFKGFRPLQFFVKHRGVIHSFTLCFIISLVLAFFWPVVSFGFFLGYGLHLLVDSFTVEGIMPFWPYSKKSSWRFKTGGLTETSVFFLFILLDIIVVVFIFF
jgi:membrane-bound metal-dependent hydrolase YbcI (DUF457 family)